MGSIVISLPTAAMVLVEERWFLMVSEAEVTSGLR